jgi:excisionase family DNA binding protein
MSEPLLTVRELAMWLRMSIFWVYKQVEKGSLPFHRVGKVLRFDQAEICSYLDERRNIKRAYRRTTRRNEGSGV